MTSRRHSKCAPREVGQYFQKLQASICQALAEEDGKSAFQSDLWHSDLGHGDTRILEGGALFEKAGVNFSHIKAKGLPQAASERYAHLRQAPFEAMGISLVVHPQHPHVPIVHANFRFFNATPKAQETVWWFGGGFDLTPCYGFVEDCVHWHQTAKKACDPFGPSVYSDYKTWCDQYFYLPHRRETRGIGGLFFDDLQHWPMETCFAFVKSLGDHFLQAYLPIVQRRKHMSYTKQHKQFQCYRRGRYVEFNLLYDRGTLFGLQSQGRVESILMSLPPQAHWHYNPKYPEHTPEADLQRFLVPQDWLAHL